MNAKEELLEKLDYNDKTIDDIDFIKIRYEGEKTNINQLDFEYDRGFGSQELEGVVVFKDHTWLERHEYDGSEWWEYKKCPTRKK